MSTSIHSKDVGVSYTSTEVTGGKDREVVFSSPTIIETDPDKELVVTGRTKEYTILGDSVYIEGSGGTPPVWLEGMINALTTNAIQSSIDGYSQLNQSLLDAMDSINIAKNGFASKAYVNETAESVVAAKVEQLNASIGETQSTITDLQTTVVEKDLAVAAQIESMEASLNENITARMDSISTAVTTAQESFASQLDVIESTFESLGESQASAIAQVQSEVTTLANAQQASVQQIDTLEASFSETSAQLNSAISTLETSVESGIAGVASLFAYNSDITLDGVTYKSGFGLAANGSNSEFWVKADKFKLIGSSGDVLSPFTVSGGDITFNGTINLNNVAGASGLATTSSLPQVTEGAGAPTGSPPIGSVHIQKFTVQETNDSGAVVSVDRSKHWVMTTGGWKVSGSTVISGNNITTGIIQSQDKKFIIDLDNRFIRIAV